MLLLPRMRTRAPPPVVPPLCVTTAPATRPWSSCEALVTGASSTSAVLTTPTELPISRWRCSRPVAVTTSPPISSAEAMSWKLVVAVPPAASVTRWVRGA
jgi:hypothetical protein